LLPLQRSLEAKVNAAGLKKVATIEQRCVPAMVWLGQHGVGFDADAWTALCDQAQSEAEQLAKAMDGLAPQPEQSAFFSGWTWVSPAQVQEAFQRLGCPLESTDDEALARANHPLADLLRRYRAARKRCTTYGREWLKHVADDGRVYSGWRQIGAASGRM